MNELLIFDNGKCQVFWCIIDGYVRYEVRPRNKKYGTLRTRNIDTAVDIADRICKHENKQNKLLN